MTIQQNGGFVSHGDGPKEKVPPTPVNFKVSFTCWDNHCDISDDSIIVKALSYDEAVSNATAELKRLRKWKQVIAIFAVTFQCDKWGRALTQYGQLQFEIEQV